ncbi:hypothetical protein V7S43_015290 [Phytophthora oleae]|uniref:Uncharacterized protein n=1 Tax=Phytophthora oleae TaxID=2107226 RepID=A0ABD3F3B5_9STRA
MDFQYEDEFRKFHLQPIAVQEKPLSMECKTAFLSAFRSESSRRSKKAKSGEEPSSLPLVDTFVVSNIFVFGAEPVKRKVFFSKGWRSELQKIDVSYNCLPHASRGSPDAIVNCVYHGFRTVENQLHANISFSQLFFSF